MIRYVVGIDLTSVTGVVIHAGKLSAVAAVYKGPKGEPGATGPAGPKGEIGPQGPKGDPGDAASSIVVSGNTNAVNDGNYTNVASATYTDPSPVEGKGFRVMVRNGTATVGGTGYSTAGTVILRIFDSGSWVNYVYQVAGGGSAPEIMYCRLEPVTVTGLTAETLVHSLPIPTNIGNGMLRIIFFLQASTFVSNASMRIRVGTISNPNTAQMIASRLLATNSIGSATGDIFRKWPIIGGASGNIKAAIAASNARSDEATAGLLVTYNIDWTTQHYIYFTATPSNTGNVLVSNGILVEFIKEQL